MRSATTRAYLGLGGNLGDPAATMAEALRRLDRRADVTVVGVSRLFSTAPWGRTDQPGFVNAAAAVDTTLDAEALLDACLEVERSLKRERRERWGPRTIDIDILVFGMQALRTDRLSLPHARLTERAFALVPLADLAPDLRLGERDVASWLGSIGAEGVDAIGEDRGWWRAG